MLSNSEDGRRTAAETGGQSVRDAARRGAGRNAAARRPERAWLAELQAGDAVDEIYYLREAEERRTREGRPYLSLRISDRSGIMDARMWETGGGLPGLRADSFARLRGRVESWRGRLRLRLDAAMPERAERLDQHDFLPSSFRSTEELAGFLRYFLTEVYDADYRQLLSSFFDSKSFLDEFCLAPGDARSHHAYLGGLLEHTVAVTTLCQHTAVQHPRLDADLLITAALLHDIGKMEEFSYRGRIRLSRRGRLLGHVLLGQRMIERRLEELGGFPEEKELALVHAVISHHGELEWGAPKRPQSAEALVLHHLDNLDARVKGFFEVVQGSGELAWEEMQNYFRRPLSEPRAADRESGSSGDQA